MAFRDSSTHGHQTNNFCEVSIRLFKDVVLRRNKAYNIIALIDFIVTCLEEYYQKRIRNFVHSRNPKAKLILINLLKKSSGIKKSDIKWNTEKVYEVPSMSNKSELCGWDQRILHLPNWKIGQILQASGCSLLLF